MDEVDDALLLGRASAGDEMATAVLVRRYVRRATLLAAQLAGDTDDAEDVVAEAFVIALDRAATFRAGERLGPWLYGIVRRVAARHRRRVARRRWLLARWQPERRTEPGADALVAARDTLDRVAAIVDRLPTMQRQCFDLVVRNGFDIREVAEMFGITTSTVRQHVFRARDVVRAALGESHHA